MIKSPKEAFYDVFESVKTDTKMYVRFCEAKTVFEEKHKIKCPFANFNSFKTLYYESNKRRK